MTVAVRQKVKVLERNIRVNSKRINSSLPKTGPKPDAAVIASAAKYYETLAKLAQE